MGKSWNITKYLFLKSSKGNIFVISTSRTSFSLDIRLLKLHNGKFVDSYNTRFRASINFVKKKKIPPVSIFMQKEWKMAQRDFNRRLKFGEEWKENIVHNQLYGKERYQRTMSDILNFIDFEGKEISLVPFNKFLKLIDDEDLRSYFVSNHNENCQKIRSIKDKCAIFGIGYNSIPDDLKSRKYLSIKIQDKVLNRVTVKGNKLKEMEITTDQLDKIIVKNQNEPVLMALRDIISIPELFLALEFKYPVIQMNDIQFENYNNSMDELVRNIEQRPLINYRKVMGDLLIQPRLWERKKIMDGIFHDRQYLGQFNTDILEQKYVLPEGVIYYLYLSSILHNEVASKFITRIKSGDINFYSKEPIIHKYASALGQYFAETELRKDPSTQHNKRIIINKLIKGDIETDEWWQNLSSLNFANLNISEILDLVQVSTWCGADYMLGKMKEAEISQNELVFSLSSFLLFTNKINISRLDYWLDRIIRYLVRLYNQSENKFKVWRIVRYYLQFNSLIKGTENRFIDGIIANLNKYMINITIDCASIIVDIFINSLIFRERFGRMRNFAIYEEDLDFDDLYQTFREAIVDLDIESEKALEIFEQKSTNRYWKHELEINQELFMEFTYSSKSFQIDFIDHKNLIVKIDEFKEPYPTRDKHDLQNIIEQLLIHIFNLKGTISESLDKLTKSTNKNAIQSLLDALFLVNKFNIKLTPSVLMKLFKFQMEYFDKPVEYDDDVFGYYEDGDYRDYVDLDLFDINLSLILDQSLSDFSENDLVLLNRFIIKLLSKNDYFGDLPHFLVPQNYIAHGMGRRNQRQGSSIIVLITDFTSLINSIREPSIAQILSMKNYSGKELEALRSQSKLSNMIEARYVSSREFMSYNLVNMLSYVIKYLTKETLTQIALLHNSSWKGLHYLFNMNLITLNDYCRTQGQIRTAPFIRYLPVDLKFDYLLSFVSLDIDHPLYEFAKHQMPSSLYGLNHNEIIQSWINGLCKNPKSLDFVIDNFPFAIFGEFNKFLSKLISEVSKTLSRDISVDQNNAMNDFLGLIIFQVMETDYNLFSEEKTSRELRKFVTIVGMAGILARFIYETHESDKAILTDLGNLYNHKNEIFEGWKQSFVIDYLNSMKRDIVLTGTINKKEVLTQIGLFYPLLQLSEIHDTIKIQFIKIMGQFAISKKYSKNMVIEILEEIVDTNELFRDMALLELLKISEGVI